MDLTAGIKLGKPRLDVEYRCPVHCVQVLYVKIETVDLERRDTPSQFRRHMLRCPKILTAGQSGLSGARRAPRFKSVGSVR